jgi:hypothetical protein
VGQGIEALAPFVNSYAPDHFVVVSDGQLNTDGRPVLVLIKKGKFTEEERGLVRAHLASHPNLSALFNSGSASLMDLPTWFAADTSAFGALMVTGPREFSARYEYDVSTVHDSSPFFFFTFKTKRLFDNTFHPLESGIDWKVNLGVAVLFMLLVISFIAVLAFLILPLAVHAPARSARILPLMYFVAVGLGYILVEITFIQRFVLFLGHPTYALTVVIFLLLLSSGAGSLAARKWIAAFSRVRIPLALIIAALLLYWAVLPAILNALIGIPFPLKLLVSAAALVPLGFAMGMPFPSGLHSLEGSSDAAIEWAWAMNAGASVLGSVLAMVVAIHFGLNVTLMTGAACYAAAALLTMAFDGQKAQLAAA